MTDEQRPAPATDEQLQEDHPVLRTRVGQSLLARIDQQRETIQAQAEEIEKLKKARLQSAVGRLHNLWDAFEDMDAKQEAELAAERARADRAEAEVERLLRKCTCGSGGHPRACERHPERFAQHIRELNYEGAIDNLAEVEAELAQSRAEVERLRALPLFRLEPLDIRKLMREQDEAGGGCTDPRCRRGPHHHIVERKEIGHDGVAYSDISHYGYPKDCSTCAALTPAPDPTGSPVK